MFCHGLGIDLFFPYESKVSDVLESDVFRSHQNAGQQLRPDGDTLVGAFLLNELGVNLKSYRAPSSNLITGVDGTEMVEIQTAHTCDNGRFLLRVWRVDLLGAHQTWNNSDQPDVIVVKAVQRGQPFETARVLQESQPITFPANASSILIDAGLLREVPQSDLSITS